MKRYRARIPRAVVGIASIVMSAVTLGVAVVVPAGVAGMAGDRPEFCVVEAPRPPLVAAPTMQDAAVSPKDNS